ncbi:MAG: hypothetical protein A2Y40_08090 [Candidatus Margulisbacteria bacterium GWF2_35_9]|nr:MAG: hypothetical protein A2Y40_08090 [Candidatus Margulisbacteria bacterium GWF2_35_9]
MFNKKIVSVEVLSSNVLKNLIESNAIYKLFVDRMNEYVGLINNQGTLLFVNPAITEVLGYSENEVVGRSVFDFLTPEGMQEIVAQFGIQAQLGPNVKWPSYELTWIAKDGRHIPTKITPSSIPGSTATFAIVTDLTVIKAKEQRIRDIMEVVPAGIMEIEKDGSLSFINNSGLELMGLNREDISKDNIPEILKKVMDVVKQTIKNSDKKSTPVPISEFKVITSQGKEKWLLGKLIFINSGRDKLYATFMDITEDIDQKQNEKMLEMQTHAKRVSDQMVAGISHDFSNSLAPLAGYIDILESVIPGNDPKSIEILMYIKKLRQACVPLVALTRRFQHIIMGTFGSPERLDVRSLINLVVEDFKKDNQPIKINNQFSETTPNVVMGQQEFLSIMSHIIENAIKAINEKGDGEITIETKTLDLSETESRFKQRKKIFTHIEPGTFVCIKVNDTGVGINSEIINRIFEPYFSTRAKGSQKGMGLGLSEVLSSIEKNNGFIEVTSSIFEGTSFYIYLPVAKEKGFPS